MTKPLLRGVIKTWKEDRGFGFISPENGGRDVFVHISAIGKSTRHPEPGDIIHYQITRDKQGKFRAINASIENSKTANHKPNLSQNSKPVYLWITALVVCLVIIAGAAYFYFRSQGQTDNLF